MDYVEIDQQADLPPTKSHVRQQLRLVNRIDRLSALDLDDHDIANDQVNAIPEIDLLTVVNNRQSDLASDRKPLFSKFMQ